MSDYHLLHILAVREWMPASNHLVGYDPQEYRSDRASTSSPSASPETVGRGPQRKPNPSERVGRSRVIRHRECFRDSEVGDGCRAARQQDVLRLDIAVHDSVRVRAGKGASDVDQNLAGFQGRDRTALQARSQRFAVDKRHRVERQAGRLPGGEHRNDVGVLEIRCERQLAPNLSTDTAPRGWRKDLITNCRRNLSSDPRNTRLSPPPGSSRSTVCVPARVSLSWDSRLSVKRVPRRENYPI